MQSDKYAFIVGVGTGIAPLLPILESKAKQPMTLFFCNRYSDETYHHQIVSKDKLLEITEHLSFTREGGLSIIRLI